MLVVADLAVHILLRRAGLAADAVARDVGVAAAAVFDGVFEQLTHGGGGLFRNRRADDFLFKALHHFAVIVQIGADDVGLEQLAAVDGRSGCGQQLHRRYRHALAEGHARNIDVFHIFIGDHLP